MKLFRFFSARRKALVPFVPVVVLISNYYLGVAPAAHMSSGDMWAASIALALTALGVHTVTNDAETAAVAATGYAPTLAAPLPIEDHAA